MIITSGFGWLDVMNMVCGLQIEELLAMNSEQASRRRHRRTTNQPSRQVRQRIEATVATLPVVPEQITLPISPASRAREPFLLRDTASSTLVPFLCAVAGNHHS